jgi:hypothetical protein
MLDKLDYMMQPLMRTMAEEAADSSTLTALLAIGERLAKLLGLYNSSTAMWMIPRAGRAACWAQRSRMPSRSPRVRAPPRGIGRSGLPSLSFWSAIWQFPCNGVEPLRRRFRVSGVNSSWDRPSGDNGGCTSTRNHNRSIHRHRSPKKPGRDDGGGGR